MHAPNILKIRCFKMTPAILVEIGPGLLFPPFFFLFFFFFWNQAYNFLFLSFTFLFFFLDQASCFPLLSFSLESVLKVLDSLFFSFLYFSLFVFGSDSLPHTFFSRFILTNKSKHTSLRVYTIHTASKEEFCRGLTVEKSSQNKTAEFTQHTPDPEQHMTLF